MVEKYTQTRKLIVASALAALLVLATAAIFRVGDAPRTQGDDADTWTLIKAVRDDVAAEVAAKLHAGADVNVQDELGETALAWAVVRNNTEVVRQLLDKGADPDQLNVMGVGPLALAVTSNSVKIVEMLLDQGANPNASRKGGETPLMTAVRMGAPGVVRLLLSHDANVNAREETFGQTVLMWATGRPEIVRILLDEGADLTPVTKSWEITAPNYTPITFTLGVTGIPWNHDGLYKIRAGGQGALHFAVQKNDIESVKMLLESGADVNIAAADGTTPLLESLYHWHEIGLFGRQYEFAADLEIANLLLEHGAKVDLADQAGYTPLHGAVLSLVLQDPKGALRLAFDPGRGNEPERMRPKPPAREIEGLALVQRLLDAGADPNQPTLLKTPGPVNYVRINACPPGSTPFHAVAAAHSKKLVQLLGEHGADPNRVREDGHTPFSLAVMNNDLPVVQAMVELGADIQLRYNPIDEISDPIESETRRRSQQTILHIAAVSGSEWVIGYLASEGASVHAKNDLGETPFELADAQERYRQAKELEGHQGEGSTSNTEREVQTTTALKAALNSVGIVVPAHRAGTSDEKGSKIAGRH